MRIYCEDARGCIMPAIKTVTGCSCCSAGQDACLVKNTERICTQLTVCAEGGKGSPVSSCSTAVAVCHMYRLCILQPLDIAPHATTQTT